MELTQLIDSDFSNGDLFSDMKPDIQLDYVLVLEIGEFFIVLNPSFEPLLNLNLVIL